MARSAREAPAARGGPDEVEQAPAAPSWVPLAGCDLTVYVVGGDTAHTETFTARTNRVGQVDLEIDAAANTISFGAHRNAFATLDLRTQDDDFFVWAACGPAQAPGAISGRLTSNVVQFWVARETPPAPAKKGRR